MFNTSGIALEMFIDDNISSNSLPKKFDNLLYAIFNTHMYWDHKSLVKRIFNEVVNETKHLLTILVFSLVKKFFKVMKICKKSVKRRGKSSFLDKVSNPWKSNHTN